MEQDRKLMKLTEEVDYDPEGKLITNLKDKSVLNCTGIGVF